jgi:ABC-type uncharacterized transport system ATPase component
MDESEPDLGNRPPAGAAQWVNYRGEIETRALSGILDHKDGHDGSRYQVIAVIGAQGSGKSTLLNYVVGDPG